MSLETTLLPYTPLSLDDVPNGDEDQPIDGPPPELVGAKGLTRLVFGGATLSHFYNKEDFFSGTIPLRTVRLALRYGITTFDTSPYYGSSEIVLGAILRSLNGEFPRSSYKLMTKAGRYGLTNFDYSPKTVRSSVLRSLSRLGTDHLDVVFMHDVEFVATPVKEGTTAGDHRAALEDPESWGMKVGDEARIRGEGDQRVLDAVRELFKMKEERIIKAVGISGLPLPTLLRIALMVLHNPPYHPLDILLSYAHYTLQNSNFVAFLPHFLRRAKIPQLVQASPLSMGLLTSTPPAWHPAPAGMILAKDKALASAADWKGGLPNLALGFSLSPPEIEGAEDMRGVPCVLGLSTLKEVHEAVQVWREVGGGMAGARKERVETARKAFIDGGWEGFSWQSPS